MAKNLRRELLVLFPLCCEEDPEDRSGRGLGCGDCRPGGPGITSSTSSPWWSSSTAVIFTEGFESAAPLLLLVTDSIQSASQTVCTVRNAKDLECWCLTKKDGTDPDRKERERSSLARGPTKSSTLSLEFQKKRKIFAWSPGSSRTYVRTPDRRINETKQKRHSEGGCVWSYPSMVGTLFHR